MKNTSSIIILLIVLASCKTIGIQKQTYNQVELAIIGITNNELTQKEFQTNAIPKLNNKIRVGVLLKEFSKTSFKAYQNANKQFGKATGLNYVDSLETKPKYISLKIMDKVGLLNNLNNNNKQTINYLKTANNPEIITSLSLVFPQNIQKAVLEAEELYITQNKNHKYVLELISKENAQSIPFSNATIFNYKTNVFCWGINDTYQIELVAINKKCSKNTYQSYQRAKKKNEFHFIKL